MTAVTRGALRDSAVSLLSPTQDHINDLRPAGELPTLTDGDASRAKGVTSNARTLTERDVSHRGDFTRPEPNIQIATRLAKTPLSQRQISSCVLV